MVKKRVVILYILVLSLLLYQDVSADNWPLGTIFVTRESFEGNLLTAARNRGFSEGDDFNIYHPINGVDYLCQRAAGQAELDGAWIAIISGYNRNLNGNCQSLPDMPQNNECKQSAIQRINYYYNNFYDGKFRTMRRDIIANRLEGEGGLFNGGNIETQIIYDEHGQRVPDDVKVWTATKNTGMIWDNNNRALQNDCMRLDNHNNRIVSWAGNDNNGVVGNPRAVSSQWIDTETPQRCNTQSSLYCIKVGGPYCGNEIMEAGEECDGGRNIQRTCRDLGWDEGNLGCTNTCRFDTSGCRDNYCGDGDINNGEQCEGNNLNGNTCITLGYHGGTLLCNNRCNYDYSRCEGHYVFVTQEAYIPADLVEVNANAPGVLRGLAGAHEICRREAQEAGLNGWWKAFLSVSDLRGNTPDDALNKYEVRDFLKKYNTAYILRNGVTIANNWNDLIDESLLNPINLNARNERTQYGYAWSNTQIGGGVSTNIDCNQFTGPGGNEYTARASEISSNWLYRTADRYCSDNPNNKLPLYCFQQEFDGDADSIDCGLARGSWLDNGECGLYQCDTFHGEDYQGGFCCGDDRNEVFMRDNVAGNGITNACCSPDSRCVSDGTCQTGYEGGNYEGSCNDGLDNNCNGLIDDEDPLCISNVVLSASNNNMCDYQSQRFGISLRNNNNYDIGGVSITDQIYNSNNQLVNMRNKVCEVVVGRGGGCIDSYNINLDMGEYYHNIEAVYDNQRITKNNYMRFTILDNENNACCAEGTAPTGGRICCGGMPADGPGGSCGCPRGFTWDIDLRRCTPIAGQICWSSNEEEREEIGLCMFRWFTPQWWGDRFNQNLVDCFRFHQNNDAERNPTQVCCPYITYDGKDYGEYRNVVVY